MTDTNRRRLLVTTALATTTALAGCTGTTDTPDAIALEIETKGTWEGTIRRDGTTKRVAGRGSERYEWTDSLSLLHISIAKGPRTDTTLTLTVLADDEPIKEESTTDPKDRIQVNYSP